MKQYIVRFLKTRFLVIFGGATLFYELFFFILLWCKTAVYAPPFALWTYVPALVWYLLDILLTFRFRRIIRYQERLFHVKFSNTNAAALYTGSNTFLSDDWLIFSGRSAFCRQYIQRISIVTARRSMGNDYRLKLYTTDGKTYLRTIDSHTNAKKYSAGITDSLAPIETAVALARTDSRT